MFTGFVAIFIFPTVKDGNITHTRRFVHAFLTGKFYSVKISVTFFVTESPSFHHQMMEIAIDMMEID